MRLLIYTFLLKNVVRSLQKPFFSSGHEKISGFFFFFCLHWSIWKAFVKGVFESHAEPEGESVKYLLCRVVFQAQFIYPTIMFLWKV